MPKGLDLADAMFSSSSAVSMGVPWVSHVMGVPWVSISLFSSSVRRQEDTSPCEDDIFSEQSPSPKRYREVYADDFINQDMTYGFNMVQQVRQQVRHKLVKNRETS